MASIGNAFQFIGSQVAEAVKGFAQQKGITEQNQSIVKSFGPKVQSGWIGGDADEFNADIIRKLVPKYAELAAAFKGVELNLTKSSNQVAGADKQAAGLASRFEDTCSKIY